MDTPTSSNTPEGPIWISAADAAEMVGVTPATVRTWVEQGRIVSRRGAGPLGEQVFVRMDEVRSKSSDLGGDPDAIPDLEPEPPAQSSDLSPIFKAFPDLIKELQSATDRAARAEMKVEFMTQQIHELKDKVRTLEGTPPVPRTQAAPPSTNTPETTTVPPAAAPSSGSTAPPEMISAEGPQTERNQAPPSDLWSDAERAGVGGGPAARMPGDLWSSDFNTQESSAKDKETSPEKTTPSRPSVAPVPKKRRFSFLPRRRT